uniref:Ubiquitin-like domain-containing protein n=2 Tax=Phytophthora ramorum TaxID=164328 RepID=H3G5H7_PHYRM
QLQDEHTLLNYNISTQSIVHLELQLRGGGTYMTVFVDFFYGRTAAVQCTSTDTVAYIKARIEDKEGIPPEDQRLVFAGKRLQDDCTLSFYNIGNADTLHSMGRILGG